MKNSTQYRLLQKTIQILGIVAIVASFLLVIWLYNLGILNDSNQMKDLVKRHDILGPLSFIGIQILQVVFPVIPGGVTTVVGFLVFGQGLGFLLNYLGIVIGSVILFALVKRYGRKFILLFVKEEEFFKYERKLETKGYNRFFILCMISPISPADILVMITGLTNMTVKRFTLIMILTKPISIISYSYIWIYGGKWLQHLLQ